MHYVFVGKPYALVLLLAVIGCTRDYPSLDGPRVAVVTPPTATTPGGISSTPGPAVSPAPFDTLKIPPPRFSPDGGTFYLTPPLRLTADSLPPGATIEYSLDNGSNWLTGNGIMSHGPVPDLGWFNFNGMAASAPEKDFVHLLTGRLRALYPAIAVNLESGGGLSGISER